MATKEETLQYVQTLGELQVVTKEELIAAFDTGKGVRADHTLIKKLDIAEILYYIGGAIVFLGITILLAQNWSTLSFSTKVLATLGTGIAAYFAGLVFNKDVRTEAVGSAFFLISALVMPVGLYVVFDKAGLDMNSSGTHSLISGILLGAFLLSYALSRKNVFLLFSILFGTEFFFNLTSFMIGSGPYFDGWKFSEYRTLVVGISYMFLGYAFSKNEHAPLSGFLYGFGVLGFLGSAMFLGGWKPNQNVFWELIYPVLIFGTLFLSVYVKSRSFLTWGTIFLMMYILKITSEYFSSGLGWPLALVIAGLAMIGIGYLSLSLKNKYFSA